MKLEIGNHTWPDESTLVERAERSLNVVRPSPPHHLAPFKSSHAISEMEERLNALQRGAVGLVPAGFESVGPFAPLKRLLKKVTRRLVWWYVEPRWVIQREINAELAAFVQASIQANLSMSAELEALQSRMADLQRGSRGIS